MSVIQDYVNEPKIKSNIRSKFDTIIGGGCLIMKDPNDTNSRNPFRYIILYNEIKDKEGNEIDFFLYIEDKKKREDTDIYILRYGLFNFFAKIKYSYTDEYKKFEAGYIVRSCTPDRIKLYLAKLESKKSMPPPSPKIASNVARYITSMPNKQKNAAPESLLNAIILGLFQIKHLTFALTNNQNAIFNNFKEKIVNVTGHKINTLVNPSQILNEIISKLELIFGTKYIKESFNQVGQYDSKRKEKFLANHVNGNIIQKFILIPKEEEINCKECHIKSYQYKYERFIYINEIIQNGLSELIFGSIQEEKLSKLCNFCNGKETKCTIENKIIYYPQVLIVVISKNVFNKFSFNNNVYLSNSAQSISYSLNHFIEAGTNSFYFICSGKKDHCQKFENNQWYNPENVMIKRPIVLFYYLIKNNNNMNINPSNINMQQQQQKMNMQNMNINSPNNLGMNNFSSPVNNQKIASNNMNMPFNQNNNNAPNNGNMAANNGKIPDNQTQNNIMNNMIRSAQTNNNNPMINQNFSNPNQNNGVAGQNFFFNQNFVMNNNFNPISNKNISMPNNVAMNNINAHNQNFGLGNNQNIQNNAMMQNQNLINHNQMNIQNQNQNQMNMQNQNMMINQNQMNMVNQNFNMQNQMNRFQNMNMQNQFGSFQNNNGQNNNFQNMNVMNNNNMNNNPNMNMNINNQMNNNMNNQMNNNMNMNNQNMNMNNMNMNINNQMNNNMNNQMNNNKNMNNQNMNMNNMNMNMNNQITNMNNFNNNNAVMNNNNLQFMNNNGMFNNNMMNMNINMNNNQNMNFINNNMNNFNMNQGQNQHFNNNNNGNNQNNAQNAPQNNQKQATNKKDEIFVTFTFKKNGEQIYIDVDKNEKFCNAITMLETKYNWLTKIINKKYYLGREEIKEFNKTLKALGIKDNSDIIIVA